MLISKTAKTIAISFDQLRYLGTILVNIPKDGVKNDILSQENDLCDIKEKNIVARYSSASYLGN